MAKTKAGKQNGRSRRNSAYDDDKNGLYMHSSPPKVVSNSEGGSGSASIREYLRGGNIPGLEEVVLQGHGHKLLTQSSTDQRVRAFLKTLPSFISKIDLVHDAAERGDMRDLKSLLDRRKLARSRDSQGMGLLHKAVVSGNSEMVDYLMQNYPETAEIKDNDERTALHLCAASKSPDEIYSQMISHFPSPQARDSRGRTASNYMARPGDLQIVRKTRFSSNNRKKGTPNKRNQKLSTPPKRDGINISGANIRIWIHDQDLPKLEKIVWEGQGLKLLKETSNNPKVRQFLNLVPRMMIRIKEIHQAAVANDMETLEAKADQPELLNAKDQNGLNCLHKAAALGHSDMCNWILERNPSALQTADRMGRTPLFYATLPSDGEKTYRSLITGGADAKHVDRFNKRADMYLGQTGDLDLSVVYEPPIAPRSGTGLDMSFSKAPSLAPSRMQSRAPSRSRMSRSVNPSRRNSLNATTPRRGKSTERSRSRRRKEEEEEDDENDSNNNQKRENLIFDDLSEISQDDLDKLILDGDLDKLEMVVLSGRGADIRGKSSWNEDVRKFLKKVPGYMEKVNSLHQAAGQGNLKTVKQLTAKNPKLAMARNREDGTVALHHMARGGGLAGVKHLIKIYPDARTVQDVEGKTPLHWAAMSRSPGSKEIYSFFQTLGSKEEEKDFSGLTAHHYNKTLQPGEEEEDQPSSRRGSRKNSPSKKGKNKSPRTSRNNSRNGSRRNSRTPAPSSRNPSPTPSTRSRKNGSRRNSRKESVAMVDVDRELDMEMEKSIADADDGDFETISEVIIRGDGRLLVGRHSKNEDTQEFLDKMPALLENIEEIHEAVERGETRKVVSLIDKRKKAAVRDTNQSNLLHKAVLNGHSDLTRYLVQAYPELLNQQDRAGRTPLHYAAVIRDGGHLYKVVQRAGADPSIVDRVGNDTETYLNSNDLLTEKDLKEELKKGIPLEEEEPRRGDRDSPTRLTTRDSEDYKHEDTEPNSHQNETEDTEPNSHQNETEDTKPNSHQNETEDTKPNSHQNETEDTKPNSHQNDLEDTEPNSHQNDLEDTEPNSHQNDPEETASDYPNIWTEEGQYLSQTVGEALNKGLADLLINRPGDAVGNLAVSLYSSYLQPAPGMSKSEDGSQSSKSSIGSANGSLTTSESTIAMQTAFDVTPRSGGSSVSASSQTYEHIRDQKGRNILHIAATLHHEYEAFMNLLEICGVQMLAERDENYLTARDVAEKEGEEDNRAMIDHYVIGLAVDGKFEDLKFLMLEGYDHIVDTEDFDGKSIYEVVEKKELPKMYQYLQNIAEYEERREWLNKAINVGSLSHVQYITDSEELALGKDTKGRTALHHATLLERKDIMAYIASKFSESLSIGDNLYRTPLHYAMGVDQVDTVAKILVQAGATRNVKDLRGKLPSFYFIHRQEIVEMTQQIFDESEDVAK